MFLYGDVVSLSGNTGKIKKIYVPAPEGPGTSYAIHRECGVMGSMPVCHTGDPGSIPGTLRTLFSFIFHVLLSLEYATETFAVKNVQCGHRTGSSGSRSCSQGSIPCHVGMNILSSQLRTQNR